jgi:phage shock protein C
MQRKLYLSKTDQKLAGVCGGIAEYFDIDSTIVRLVWIFLALAGGSGLLIYIIAAIVMQDKPTGYPANADATKVVDVNSDDSNKGAAPKKDNSLLVGWTFIILGLLVFSKSFHFLRWLDFKFLLPFILICVGVYVLFSRRK